MVRLLLPAFLLAASASIAVAAPVKMNDSQLDNIVAGWNPAGHECGNSPGNCANNGWGNGWDGNNAGSYSGGTAPSKTANNSVWGAGDINMNPTTSNGR